MALVAVRKACDNQHLATCRAGQPYEVRDRSEGSGDVTDTIRATVSAKRYLHSDILTGIRCLTSLKDYIVTHYIAEFFNTVTSLAYSEKTRPDDSGLKLTCCSRIWHPWHQSFQAAGRLAIRCGQRSILGSDSRWAGLKHLPFDSEIPYANG